MKRLLFLSLLFLLIVACDTANSTAENADLSTATVAVTLPTVTSPAPVAAVDSTATVIVPPVANDTVAATEVAATPLPSATPEPIPSATPEPVATLHPAEQLITSFTAPVEANGELLIVYGQVTDVNGNPVPDVAVEIWQTDEQGIYDHPDDRTTGGRDMTFQFYGTAVANTEGWYAFRTIVPGQYEPRPRHIHFKVKQGSSTLLTSQFYFSDDIAQLQGEGLFQAAGDQGDLLLLQLVQGEGALLANGRIVVDTGIGAGSLPLTPSQAEGPFYPVVTVADYDNDLSN